MFRPKSNGLIWAAVMFVMAALMDSCALPSDCEWEPYYASRDKDAGVSDNNTTVGSVFSTALSGNGDVNFKLPLPTGYNWWVAQSWSEHWQWCDEHLGTATGSFYDSTHRTLSDCRYGWDLNRDGSEDEGLAVLASADGIVKKVCFGCGNWGNYILIDHGYDICTRYAHLLDGSMVVREGQQACQGLKIAEIGGTPNWRPHLHFQFEKCSDRTPLPRGFTDGNGDENWVPMCGDRFLSDNVRKDSCGSNQAPFGGAVLPNGGWVNADCGNLSGCPLNPTRMRSASHIFPDENQMSILGRQSAKYLYSESSLDGKADGGVHPLDRLTRAEALKIALYTFGLWSGCGNYVPYSDVGSSTWYFPVIACAVHYGIADNAGSLFVPNQYISFGEAAKYLVKSASKVRVIQLTYTASHFPYIQAWNWAFPYVETIYAYNGLVNPATNYRSGQLINREEFITMAAALSPCFCGKVNCEDGCYCEQDTYSCSGPQESIDAVGGGDEEQDEEDDDDEPADSETLLEDRFDTDINCFVKEETSGCANGRVLLNIKCEIENYGDETLRVKTLLINSFSDNDGDAEVCQITKDHLSEETGAGYQNVESGETTLLASYFTVECSQMPPDRYLDMVLDMMAKVDGHFIWYEEAYDNVNVELPRPLFHNCIVPTPPPCVPATCASLGKQCGGPYYNGCNATFMCGNCQTGYSCNTSGHCIANPPPPCVPATCASLNKQCGSGYANGCGGTLNCGNCQTGYSCNTSGRCFANTPPCVPATCASLGKQCGSYANNCGGTLNCGSCQSGYSCNTSGRCVANTPPPQTTPETVCNDGLDNDGDGAPDAGDTDCASRTVGTFSVWCRGGCSLTMLTSANQLLQFLLPTCVLGANGVCSDPALGVQQSFTFDGSDGIIRLWVQLTGTAPSFGMNSSVPMLVWTPPGTAAYPYQPTSPGMNMTSVSLPAMSTNSVVFMRLIPAGAH